MKNISRLNVTIYIIFGSIGLLIPLVVAAHHFFGIDPLSLLNIKWGRTFFGVIFTLLATAVCLFNFMQRIIEPWLYKRNHGNMKDFGGMSGLPIIGGFFVTRYRIFFNRFFKHIISYYVG